MQTLHLNSIPNPTLIANPAFTANPTTPRNVGGATQIYWGSFRLFALEETQAVPLIISARCPRQRLSPKDRILGANSKKSAAERKQGQE